MRRFLSFVFILFLAVICSACINTLAVQKLNDIAMERMNAGDIDTAISRLEASIDLDENIFETRYNLASAYIKASKCDLAIEQLDAAQKIRPKEPSVYYTLGVAYDCMADSIYGNSDDLNNITSDKNNDIAQSKDSKEKYLPYLNSAISNYEKYAELSPQAQDKDSVEERVRILKNKKENFDNKE